MTSRSFVDMRRRNALSILDIIRNQAGVSRADLSRAVDLSKATVSNIVDELISLGMVEEVVGQVVAAAGAALVVPRGRRPIGLHFCAHSRYEAGVSVDDGKCRIVICDLDGNVGSRSSLNIDRELSVAAAEQLASGIKVQLSRVGGNTGRLGAIGLALPGPLQSERPTLDDSESQLPRSYNAFARALQKAMDVDVHILSNTRAAALAEASRGGLDLDGWVLFVRLGHRVRSAIALDGRLIESENDLGGDLGELCVPNNDYICPCGRVGCINAVAATPALVELARGRGLAVDSLNQIIALVHKQDGDARDLVRQAASAIGFGIASTVNIFSPRAVVVSGSLVECGESFWSVLENSVKRYSRSENLKRCQVRKATLWTESEAIGASLFALSHDGLLPTVSQT